MPNHRRHPAGSWRNPDDNDQINPLLWYLSGARSRPPTAGQLRARRRAATDAARRDSPAQPTSACLHPCDIERDETQAYLAGAGERARRAQREYERSSTSAGSVLASETGRSETRPRAATVRSNASIADTAPHMLHPLRQSPPPYQSSSAGYQSSSTGASLLQVPGTGRAEWPAPGSGIGQRLDGGVAPPSSLYSRPTDEERERDGPVRFPGPGRRVGSTSGSTVSAARRGPRPESSASQSGRAMGGRWWEGGQEESVTAPSVVSSAAFFGPRGGRGPERQWGGGGDAGPGGEERKKKKKKGWLRRLFA
ncbi:MAG: hypothetical protein M1814_005650 [Vezdaea aestivalis]|nr:MAG: hypothetical protein M1814_005650 [Vezdaea aestivalis]